MLEENNAPKTSHPLPHCEQTPSHLLGCLPKPSNPPQQLQVGKPKKRKKTPIHSFRFPLSTRTTFSLSFFNHPIGKPPRIPCFSAPFPAHFSKKHTCFPQRAPMFSEQNTLIFGQKQGGISTISQ